MKSSDQPIQHIKKQRHYFANSVPSSQSYSFSSGQVWMCELDHKEGWVPKNWCFWAVVLEKTLESPLHCKEIKPVNPKGNQPWIFFGRTDVEAEAQHLLLFFSCSVVSNSLWPHELQHARPPCPSPTPRAYSNSNLLKLSDAIQPSHPLLSPSLAFNFSQHQGLF